jgi:hypothetical protein
VLQQQLLQPKPITAVTILVFTSCLAAIIGAIGTATPTVFGVTITGFGSRSAIVTD